MFAIGHAQSGENPELQTLFYRIECLLRLPVHAIFVFDGPERPSTKRGTCVVPTGHWMVTAMKELINAFGFIFITVSTTLTCTTCHNHHLIGTCRSGG